MPETQQMADALRTWLEQRLGAPADVAVDSKHWGDPYAGGPYIDVLTVHRDGLHITFELWEHDLSGQCDVWRLEVRGANAEDQAALADIFHPRHRRGHWSNYARVEYTFNGASAGFPITE